MRQWIGGSISATALAAFLLLGTATGCDDGPGGDDGGVDADSDDGGVDADSDDGGDADDALCVLAMNEGLEGEDGGDFAFDTAMLNHISETIKDIFIFHSKDDPVVPFDHAKRYHMALPRAHMVTFEDKGHFLMAEFPELIESIREISEK